MAVLYQVKELQVSELHFEKDIGIVGLFQMVHRKNDPRDSFVFLSYDPRQLTAEVSGIASALLLEGQPPNERKDHI